MLRVLALCAALASSAALAQSEVSGDQTQEGTSPQKQKKKKKKKARTDDGSSTGTAGGAGAVGGDATQAAGQKHHKKAKKKDAEGEEATEAEAKGPSLWFPPWGRPGFDWTLAPLVGANYTSTTTDAGTFRSSTLEGGLRAGVSNIPVVPGNPGLGLGAHAQQSWGVVATQANDDIGASTVHFTRFLGGIDGSAYVGWFRDALDVTQGRIDYDDAAKTTVQELSVTNDAGVLILPFLSGHYTYSYLRAYGSRYSDLLLTQHDNWLHARVFTDILNAYVDVGPGVTYATQYVPSEVEGTTDYVQLLTGAHLFWKIGASGTAKYVIDSSENDLGNKLANVRLPQQELGQPTVIALPADSVTATFFAGISDLFYGVGIGWRYNLQILNLSRRDGRSRLTTKDQGFGAVYHASL